VPAPDSEDVVPEACALRLTGPIVGLVTVALMVTTMLVLSVADIAGASTIREAARSTRLMMIFLIAV